MEAEGGCGVVGFAAQNLFQASISTTFKTHA